MIPDTTTLIAPGAFAFNKQIEEVTIPGSVSTMYGPMLWLEGEFHGCTGLRTVKFLGNAPSLVYTGSFNGVKAEVFYMEDDSTWTEDVKNHLSTDAELTWVTYAVVKEIASGWSGAVQWTLTDDGIIKFYGSGNMKNYGYGGGQPWLTYADQITSAVIEDGVTAVGTGAFMGLTKLKSVTLPEKGLSKIGEAAFYGCTALNEIDIPEGIYTIWSYTFKGCSALESVKIPKTLIKIDQGAFENCAALPYIFMPTNIEIIGSWSFKGCTALEEADMQWADATKIREGAFKNCTALTEIILPANNQVLGDSCFYGIGVTEFNVPATVTTIEPWCFARASVKEITFEGDAPTIGEGAFNKITLTAYYPSGNTTWTDAVKQNYGGAVSWTAK